MSYLKGKPSLSRRERVLRALEHQEPDRVPMSMTCTLEAYSALKQHMGMQLDEKPEPGVWTEVPIHLHVAERFGLDLIRVEIGSPRNRPAPKDPQAIADDWGIEWKRVYRSDESYYYEMSRHPLAEATITDLDGYPWPDPDDEGFLDGVEERFRRLHQETDFAILTRVGGAVFELATWLRGMERWYLDLAEDQAFATALMAKLADIQIRIDRRILPIVGKYIDILQLSGEDMGTQQGPMISLGMFRRLVRPHLVRVWSVAKEELIKQNPRGKIMLHSCGSVRLFLNDWVEMGLDALDPMQPGAAGMDFPAIKAEVGDRLAFHGGIDLQWVLPFGTPEDVRQEVRERIRVLGPNGGYILAPAHNVQGDVPAENLIAMRDAVEEFGFYPLS